MDALKEKLRLQDEQNRKDAGLDPCIPKHEGSSEHGATETAIHGTTTSTSSHGTTTAATSHGSTTSATSSTTSHAASTGHRRLTTTTSTASHTTTASTGVATSTEGTHGATSEGHGETEVDKFGCPIEEEHIEPKFAYLMVNTHN